ncbi:hypothetical protein Cni_G22570 [Canna indica]|uniref:Uncharacterized protein n=1 Tax=Canna indica TaxID=4628 RepID=A0AAQ3QIE4_9LILI|nr:hypothetical protein Cni_G22570 [Canna indica]
MEIGGGSRRVRPSGNGGMQDPLSESARTVGAGPTVPVVQAGRMLKSSNLQSQTSRSIIGLYSVQGLEKMTADAINITRET